ncbi:LacI family DNA-binding transcriptional regulator [Streptomyces sp. NPDC057582]|uniref:LacI family DNA-binding transcriptional regulator n=1 Tax=unclassified Streptomyces TaxID=2593676 RepID=UPI0036AB27EC
MNSRRRSATSIDVARAAGVSQSTVSRALRGDPSVSAATRERIEEAAASLGYVPMESGRNLSTRATKRVGIVAPDLTNQFYPELIEPMRRALDRGGFRTILIPATDQDEQGLRSLANGSVDGVIFMNALLGDRLPNLVAARGVPTVLVNRELDQTSLDTSVVDNYGGAQLVADLIVSLGHERIAAILGPSSTSTSRDREAGFRMQLADHGIPLPSELMFRGSFSHETGSQGIDALLALRKPPTAIFCLNDVVAIGALSTLHRHGYTPGKDVTVVGFDDISMASWDVFSLTTVRCGLVTLAESAVELLLKRIADPSREHTRVVTAPELVLRSSHGPYHR